MQKLFFAALIATVAVGGAKYANAINIYPESGDAIYICTNITNPTCLENLPSTGKLYQNFQKTIEFAREDLADYHFNSVD